MARTLLLIIPVGVIARIGVVCFVTTVIFAMMSRTGGALEKALLFQGVKGRFAGTARSAAVQIPRGPGSTGTGVP
jgi:hypothetical protein